MAETRRERVLRRETKGRIDDDAAAERMRAQFETPIPLPTGAGGGLRIAAVDDDAAGGGHYYCYLQRIDATNWDKDAAATVDDTGYAESVIVCNLAEMGSSVHNLDTGDRLICWQEKDDEGNWRWVGFEAFGRHTFGEK
jgi:hypothetical protein